MILRLFLWLFVLLIAAAVAVGGYGYLQLNKPLVTEAKTIPISGTTISNALTQLKQNGVDMPDALAAAILKYTRGDKLKPGLYELPAGATGMQVLQTLIEGKGKLITVRIVEGATFREIRAALAEHPWLKKDLNGKDDAAVMAQLGLPGVSPEAQFFPDTYHLSPLSAESAVLKAANTALKKRLDAAWAARKPEAAVKTPEEALNLASIIEKETGLDKDRPLVSAVFNNRLRIGMRLQTDPTIIYGLGESFDGNLRKIHLTTDAPYNTYTRAGLPPTPIAAPSDASIRAATQPAKSDALYFVARGDGTTLFSKSLTDHNNAVNKYQKGG
ncbi:MAG: endolytic transglycosylase MltG [Burkholderiaceae bacterium]